MWTPKRELRLTSAQREATQEQSREGLQGSAKRFARLAPSHLEGDVQRARLATDSEARDERLQRTLLRNVAGLEGPTVAVSVKESQLENMMQQTTRKHWLVLGNRDGEF